MRLKFLLQDANKSVIKVVCKFCIILFTKLLKVHKNENFFGLDFEFCTISLLVMSKY